MAYPSVIATLTNPNATDKLNSPAHHTVETNQNTEVVAIETFIGLDGSASTLGTLLYDVRSPASHGGGHVQSADSGGTGQTIYSKGNLLVGQSTSVLSKLAVGTDGQVITADSTQQVGIKWGDVATAAQIQNFQYNYAQDSGNGSVLQIAPVPCVLSYTAGQLFLAKVQAANTVAAPALSVSSLVGKTIKNIDGSALTVGEIPASSLSLFGYNGSQSYFALLNPYTVPAFSSGTTTKDAQDASATQNIAHGLGKAPRYVKITGMFLATGTGQPNIALTTYNGTSQNSFSTYNTNGGVWTSGSSFSLNAANAAANQTGVVTVDGTNIIITWTKNGSSTGVYTLLWEAQS